MSLNLLMEEIGQDADLLTYSDQWLERERIKRSEDLAETARELQAILVAQKIKNILQQKNLVAAQQILRDASGEIKNIIIRIMNLPDALSMFSTTDTLDDINAAGQLMAWKRDGYDIQTSAALRIG